MPRFQRDVAPGTRWPLAACSSAQLAQPAQGWPSSGVRAQSSQLVDQLGPAGHRERGGDTDVVKGSLGVEQAQQE